MTHPSKWTAIGGPSAAASDRPADATAGFVINLCASTTPLALARPGGPEFSGYAFFVSRRLEDGRERFRLHMGHFATRGEAERLLPMVRELYPAAWVGEMPGRHLHVIAGGRAAAPPQPAPLPAVAVADPLVQVVAGPAPLHFAVQLLWSVTPIELGGVPQLKIFEAYTLYRIEGNRDGRRWYGLRLGFFTDADAAKQVASYVRAKFTQVAVVPVSVREREQAVATVAMPDEPAAEPVDPPLAGIDHDRGVPLRSVDETLEILGADALSLRIDDDDRRVATGRHDRLAVSFDPPAPRRSLLARAFGRLVGRSS